MRKIKNQLGSQIDIANKVGGGELLAVPIWILDKLECKIGFTICRTLLKNIMLTNFEMAIVRNGFSIV